MSSQTVTTLSEGHWCPTCEIYEYGEPLDGTHCPGCGCPSGAHVRATVVRADEACSCTAEPNWADVVRETCEAAGFAIDGLAESLTAEQANDLLQELIAKLRNGAGQRG